MNNLPTNSKLKIGWGYTLNRNTRAFTLIELLVVIAIIGILAAVVIASLNGARDKARISKVASDLRNIELAFNMLYSEIGCWPKERNSQASTYCSVAMTSSTGNPTMAQAIASNTTNFSNYLSSAPVFPFPHDGNGYRYDNDINNYDGLNCGSLSPADYKDGVNIYISSSGNNQTEIFNSLNDIFDKEEIGQTFSYKRTCGKVGMAENGNIFYKLSWTQQ